jgi:hypothetical protein
VGQVFTKDGRTADWHYKLDDANPRNDCLPDVHSCSVHFRRMLKMIFEMYLPVAILTAWAGPALMKASQGLSHLIPAVRNCAVWY